MYSLPYGKKRVSVSRICVRKFSQATMQNDIIKTGTYFLITLKVQLKLSSDSRKIMVVEFS